MRFVILASLLIAALPAQASRIEWTLDNIELWNPGYVLFEMSGSFVYNADTNQVDSVDLLVSQFDGIQLSHGFDADGNGTTLFFTETDVNSLAEFDNYSGWAIWFQFDSSLTNAGGSANLTDGIFSPEGSPLTENQFGRCSGGVQNCYLTGAYNASYDPLQYGGGTFIGTPAAVPIPAAVWLFGSALAGLGWIRKKQTDWSKV